MKDKPYIKPRSAALDTYNAHGGHPRRTADFGEGQDTGTMRVFRMDRTSVRVELDTTGGRFDVYANLEHVVVPPTRWRSKGRPAPVLSAGTVVAVLDDVCRIMHDGFKAPETKLQLIQQLLVDHEFVVPDYRLGVRNLEGEN